MGRVGAREAVAGSTAAARCHAQGFGPGRVHAVTPAEDFRRAISAAGLTPPEVIEADGELYRFSSDGRRGDDAGWYVLHGDGIPAGEFGCWRAGIRQTWRADIGRELTEDERQAQRERIEAAHRQREAAEAQRHADGARRARKIWEAGQPAPADHPYLTARGVGPHALRVYRGDIVIRDLSCDNSLIVPLRGAAGTIQTLEFIGATGEKRYLPGGATSGAYHALGAPAGTIIVCEGWATGAAIHEATGFPVRCAMSAGNLRTVAELMRARASAARIIVAGDHDGSGTGQRAAHDAARAINGLVALPADTGDWNDVYRTVGADAVRAGIGAVAGPATAAQSLRRALDPTPLIRPLSPPAPYPVDALGPILGPAARAIAEIVQVPEALAGGCVLATAALAAQAHADVQTLGGARPLSLYVLTIASSGDRKTAADDVALAPVREYERRTMLGYQMQVAEYERAQQARKLDRAKARKEAESGAEYAAALREIADEPPPRKPWIVCSEPTAEGLMRSLADGQYAQGIYTDEGGQFLGGHALSEEAELRTIAMLSRVWQGARLDRVRATDHEHMILYGRRVSMHLLVQPDVATCMLGRALYRSQGFLARWLIAAPETLAGTRLHDPSRPAPTDDPRIRRYWHALGELLARPATEDHEVGGLSLPCLALSAEARDLLRAAYDEIEIAQGREGELESVREWAGKAAEHACRIAGVLTLTADPAASAVSGETMGQALTLTQHYLGEYVRLIGSADVPEHVRQAALLLDWLRAKRRQTVTARDIMRLGPSSIRSGEAAKAALRTLAEHSWLATDDHRTYTAHPASLADEETP
jgi:putative DNA primase/helicase